MRLGSDEMFKKGKSGVTSPKRPAREAEPQAVAAAEVELRYDEDFDDAVTAGSTEDTARYIADMVGALAAMAGEARLDLLTYLLNMARVEAELQARQTEEALED